MNYIERGWYFMLTWSVITALRMKRQFLLTPVNQEGYDALFNLMSPVPTMYWCVPGDPPSLPLHVDFDDYDYNSKRRARREILKGRFGGGSIAYVTKEDLELFACLYKKELKEFTAIQSELLELLKQEGPMNIGLMKQITGLLVKEITPALHKLQEAFLIYEDQLDNDGDRGWYLFDSEFPELDLNHYTKTKALQLVIPRFARLLIFIDDDMLKSYYKVPLKLIKEAISQLLQDNILQVAMIEGKRGYQLVDDEQLLEDIEFIQSQCKLETNKSKYIIPEVLLLQRNDFMVQAYSEQLKKAYPSQWDALYYLLIDGVIQGVVTGRFKFGPHVIEEIILDLGEEEKKSRKNQIIEAVYEVFDCNNSPIKLYDGKHI